MAPKRLLLLLLTVLPALQSLAQVELMPVEGDTVRAEGLGVGRDSCFLCRPSRFSPGRFWGLTAVTATGYTATVVGLDRIWYAQYPRGNFRFFDDFGEWKDVDKAGHLLTAYLETKYAHELYRWTGLRESRALWAGIAVGTIFQGTLEVLDGFSEQWGASPGDLLFNTAGTALYAGQQALWGEQKMVLKYSWHPVSHDDRPLVSLDNPQETTTLRQRAKDLYGTFFFERMLKDYNGTTCWLSVNVHAFLRPESRFPKWLNFAVGYGAENLYGASSNTWIDAEGNRFQADPERFPRYGQWFFSPDIDFTRIPAKKRGWKLLLSALNLLKTPAPTLEINGRGRFKFHWLYF
jgi:hypothetical protein